MKTRDSLLNNEQILLNMFKQHHYDETIKKVQKMVMILSALVSAVSAVITSIFFIDILYVYIFTGAIICMGVLLILQAFRIISLRTVNFIYMIYFCFILTPVLWYLTRVLGSAPYVSLIILVAILIMFHGKRQKWMLFSYLTLILGLLVYSMIIEIPITKDIPSLIYTIVAYVAAVILISLYMTSKLKKYEQMHEQFLGSSIRDDLTKLFNRKVLDIIMQYEEQLYYSDNCDYILIMLDVDKFKQMNDEHGHVYGDIILRNIAKCLDEKVRSSDFVIRYGGDEFLVVQTAATSGSISAFINRIEDAMKKTCFLDIKVSVSYGYGMRSECSAPEEVLKLADKRLYEHKETKKKDILN